MSIVDALEEAVGEVDPTDVVSLLDALESPGIARTQRPPSSASSASPRSCPISGGTGRAGPGPDSASDRHNEP